MTPLRPGAVETTLAEVLTARGRALRLPLGPDSAGPVIVISASEDASIGAEVCLRGGLAGRMRSQQQPQACCFSCSAQHPHPQVWLALRELCVYSLGSKRVGRCSCHASMS